MVARITAENRADILKIMRSISVCLDIIYKKPKLSHKIKIQTSEEIVEILFDKKLSAALDPELSAILNSTHAEIHQLPQSSLDIAKELVISIKKFEKQLIESILHLVNDEDQITQLRVKCLIDIMFEEICKIETPPGNGSGYGGYGGYGYGGYGYGGYGYGGYGYGGYGYGGYGYGGYGYGGYGYGGYGYCGYGCGYGYGYGGYGYAYGYDCYNFKTREHYKELWNNQDFIWLNQCFVDGVSNAEGLVWIFKDAKERFTPEEGKLILEMENITSGDHDEVLFRAVTHAAVKNPEIYNKLKPI